MITFVVWCEVVVNYHPRCVIPPAVHLCRWWGHIWVGVIVLQAVLSHTTKVTIGCLCTGGLYLMACVCVSELNKIANKKCYYAWNYLNVQYSYMILSAPDVLYCNLLHHCNCYWHMYSLPIHCSYMDYLYVYCNILAPLYLNVLVIQV